MAIQGKYFKRNNGDYYKFPGLIGYLPNISLTFEFVEEIDFISWFVNREYNFPIYTTGGRYETDPKTIMMHQKIFVALGETESYYIEKNTSGYYTNYWFLNVTSSTRSGSGTVSGSATNLLAGKESCTLTATPLDSSWELGGWYDGSTYLNKNLTFNYTPSGTSDKHIQAVFVKKTYLISLTSEAVGKVRIDSGAYGSSASKSIEHGNSITIEAEANNKDEYRFLKWVSTVPNTFEEIKNPHTYTPTVSRTWKATFVKFAWKVTVSSEGNGLAIVGTIGQDVSGYFPKNNDVVVRAWPEVSTRTAFDYWKDSNGNQLSTLEIYSFKMPGTYDINLVAVFKEKAYLVKAEYENVDSGDTEIWGTVSLTANGKTLTTSNDVSSVQATAYWINNPVMLKAVVKDHGVFIKWVDSDLNEYFQEELPVESSDYTERTYIAYFDQADLYSVTLSPDGMDVNGNTLSVKTSAGAGSGDDAGKYYEGPMVIEAVPAAQWQLAQWDSSGTGLLPSVIGDEGFSNTIGFVLKNDVSVTATFEPKKYTVAWSVDTPSVGHGTITKTGATVFTYGAVVNLEAVPVGTNVFKGWYTPEGVLVSLSAYTTITVTTDVAYVAKFGNTVSISINAGAGNTGNSTISVTTPEGTSATSATFTFGDTVSISVEVAENDHFMGWYDSSSGTLQTEYGEHASFVPVSGITFYALIESTPDPFYVKMTNRIDGFGELSMLTKHGELMTAESTWLSVVEQMFGTLDMLNDKYYKFSSVDTVSISGAKTISGAIFKWFELTPRTFVDPNWTNGTPVVITKTGQAAVTLSQNCTLSAIYYSSDPVTITLDYVTGSDSSMGEIGFSKTGTNEFTGAAIRSDFTPGSDVSIVALARNGYKFAGWYEDKAGTDDVDGALFEHQITITASSETYYAKFVQDADAIYVWEGDGVNKRMQWESKRFVNSVPFCPSAVRVDADGYPVSIMAKMSSSPDSSLTRTISAKILNQDCRRLQIVRPERYITVTVVSVFPVNSVVVGTSMEGLRQ